jgi:hypothetical protein
MYANQSSGVLLANAKILNKLLRNREKQILIEIVFCDFSLFFKNIFV